MSELAKIYCIGNILIVDDAPKNLHFSSQLLAAQGYKARVAPNGSLALADSR